MSVRCFHQDEAGYADWLAAHPHGFVFNNFASPRRDFNVLRRSTCNHLQERDGKNRTSYEKVCISQRPFLS
jgi:hypothetical protein